MAYHAVLFFNLVSDLLFKSAISILCWRPGAQLGMVGLWRNIGRIFSIQLRMNFNPRLRLTLKHTFVLIKNPTTHCTWRVFFKGPKCLTGQRFSTCFRWSHSLLHNSWTYLLLAICILGPSINDVVSSSKVWTSFTQKDKGILFTCT